MGNLDYLFLSVLLLVMILTLGIFVLPIDAHHNPDHCNPVCGGGGGTTAPPINLVIEQVGESVRLQWDYDPIITVDPDKIIIYQQEQGKNFKKLTKEKEHKEVIKNKQGGLITDFYLDNTVEVGKLYKWKVEVKYDDSSKHETETTEFFEIRNGQGVLLKSSGHIIENPTNTFVFPPFLLGFLAFADPNYLIETTLDPNNESYTVALEPIPLPQGLDEGCDETIEIIHHQDIIDPEIDVRLTIIEHNVNGTFVRNQEVIGLVDSDKRQFARFMIINAEDTLIEDYTNLELQLDFTQKSGLPAKIHIHAVNFYVPSDLASC